MPSSPSGAISRRPLPVAAAVAAAFTAAFAGWIGFGLGGPTAVRYVDDLVTILAALAASILCVRAGRSRGAATRAVWLWLGAACMSWTVAEVIWAVYDLGLRVAVPVPSWADVGYLAAIPLAAVALLSHPGMQGRPAQRIRASLDGLAIATALLCLSWTLVLGPVWHQTDLTTLGGVVAVAYPFGDIVLGFLVLLVLSRLSGEGRTALVYVLAGLLAMAVSDSAYTYLTEVGNYSTGNLIDTGWVAGYLGIAVGAHSARAPVVRTSHPAAAQRTGAFTPYLPILLTLVVVCVELRLGRRLDIVSWSSALALIVVVLVRQMVALRDGYRSAVRLSAGSTGQVPS